MSFSRSASSGEEGTFPAAEALISSCSSNACPVSGISSEAVVMFFSLHASLYAPHCNWRHILRTDKNETKPQQHARSVLCFTTDMVNDARDGTVQLDKEGL